MRSPARAPPSRSDSGRPHIQSPPETSAAPAAAPRRTAESSMRSRTPRRFVAGVKSWSSPRPPAVIEHFAEQLLHALSRRRESLAASRRRAVEAPAAALVPIGLASQIALSFHGVKDGV